MTKYAIILASILVVTGCKSERGGGYSQSDNSSSYGSNATTTPGAYSGSSTAEMQPADTGTPGVTGGVGQPGTASSTDQSAINSSTSGQSAINSSSSSQSTSDTAAANGQNGINSSGQVSGNQSATERSAQVPSTSGETAQSSSAIGGQSTSGSSSSSLNNQSAPDQSQQQGLGTIGQSGTASGTASQSSLGSGSNDQMLIQSVTNSLVSAGIPQETMKNVHVRAMNGRVILTGRVDTQTEKQKIEEKAKQTPGVQSVSDLLRVQATEGGNNPTSEPPSSQSGLNQTPDANSTPQAPTTAPGQTPPPAR